MSSVGYLCCEVFRDSIECSTQGSLLGLLALPQIC